MKKWPLLLLLPLYVGVYVSSHRAQAETSTTEPRIETQAELDDFALKHPDANFDRLGHAFANSGARLFWNTDLEAAKKQAALTGKPILSLRLLGNLNDEYSCANSRFFRVLFYPQSQINEKLRRDFVLFWSSERPVPIVTIDMGDGRILKRTLTGNSAHYLLDSTGRSLDVFPGLTTPATFEAWLTSSQKLAQEFKAQPQATRGTWLAKWHTEKLRDALTTISSPGKKSASLDSQIQEAINTNPLEDPAPVRPIAAGVAAPLALDKRLVEGPLLTAMNLKSFFLADAPLDPNAPPVLDTATRARIRAMNPLAAQQKSPASSVQSVVLTQSSQKSSESAPFDALIRTFENTLRADTRQNQNLSTSIHALFARSHEGDFESLNRRIYDRLFLTPRSDQWLGLTTDTAFSALQNDGVTLPSQTNNTPAAN